MKSAKGDTMKETIINNRIRPLSRTSMRDMYRINRRLFITFVSIIIFACILIAFNIATTAMEVYAESDVEKIENDLKDNVNDSLNDLELSELEKFVASLDDKSGFGTSLKSFIKGLINGEHKLGYSEYFKIALQAMTSGIVEILPLVMTVLAVAVIFSIINNLSSGFIGKSTTEVIYFVCYATIIVLVATKVGKIVADTVTTISSIQKFMQICFPILLTLMTALGGAVSVSVYQPLMATLSTGVIALINTVVIPCFVATMALTIVGNLTTSIKLDKLTKFFKSIGETLLGIMFSLFMTFVSIQGITGSVTDSISFRSAKFAISSYVPILGGYLSDGFDLVMASMVLIKNSLGVTGVLILLSIALVPIMKIICFTLALKLTAGIIEPIGDKRMSDIVYGISKNMTLLVIALVGVCFMFFIMLMLIIYTCNLGV